MDFVNGLINNAIQFGLLIIGLITFYLMLKKDNRKALRGTEGLICYSTCFANFSETSITLFIKSSISFSIS